MGGVLPGSARHVQTSPVGAERLVSLPFSFAFLAHTPSSVFGLSAVPTSPKAASLGLEGTEQRGTCQWSNEGVVEDKCPQVTYWETEAFVEAL